MQMHIPEDVLPPLLEHRAPQCPLVAESAVFGDAAGGVVAEGVAEFQAVEAEGVEGPAGAEGEGAGGDAPAAGLGEDPVADAGEADEGVDVVDAQVAEYRAARGVRDAEGHPGAVDRGPGTGAEESRALSRSVTGFMGVFQRLKSGSVSPRSHASTSVSESARHCRSRSP